MELWIILTLISAIVFSLRDILSKKFLKSKLEPNEFLFNQDLILFIGVTTIFFSQIDFMSINTLWYWYLLKVISVWTGMYIYLSLLKKFEISIVSPLLNLSTIPLLILTFFFLGELLTLTQLIGVFILVFSSYLLEVVINHHHTINPHKFHISQLKDQDFSFFFSAFIMLFALSLTAISDKVLLEETNIYSVLFFTSFLLVIFHSIEFIKENNLFIEVKRTFKDPRLSIRSFLTIISDVLILIALSLPNTLVSIIIPIRRTSTLFSSLFGGLLFHEKHLIKKVLMVTLMIIGVFLIGV